MDGQGASVVRPWVKRAKAEFPVLVDSKNQMVHLYNIRVIPYALLIDEKGQLIKGPMRIDIRKEKYRKILKKWLRDPDYEKKLLEEKPGEEDKDTSRAFGHQEAKIRFHLGRLLLKKGKKKRAMIQWRKALAKDPKNWVIRKQIWAVENPEKFYKKGVDYKWQKKQLEKEKSK